ncbi:MAG: hypothetical protein LBR33_07630 [Propionibacteriaceae bacterium]|nr:hypothetical protein [Propionibacteriaceae bacterium]
MPLILLLVGAVLLGGAAVWYSWRTLRRAERGFRRELGRCSDDLRGRAAVFSTLGEATPWPGAADQGDRA